MNISLKMFKTERQWIEEKLPMDNGIPTLSNHEPCTKNSTSNDHSLIPISSVVLSIIGIVFS